MNAIILSIGDELVLGQTVDTNTAWLARQLVRRGIGAKMHLTVADDRPAIAEAFREAIGQAELVIATGGLGPTDDDLTRFALADVMGAELVLDESALADIAAFFERRGRTMVERNKVQAMCPAGATMLANPAGTAPGIDAQIHGARVFCVPGVPREMIALWDRHIAPALPPSTGRVILTTRINTFGQGESDLAERLGDLMARDRNPTVGTTVSEGIVAARIRSEFPELLTAERELTATIAAVESALGPLTFGRDDTTLADAVADLLRAENLTLATAESCTGGLVAKLLTDAPGASRCFHTGYVTYANHAKQQALGVPRALLEQHGAVSQPVAIAMADGALARSEADLAISLTGIAGPDGGSDDKPVGTVWFALARAGRATIAQKHIFPGDREQVRLRAAHHALNMVRLHLLDTP